MSRSAAAPSVPSSDLGWFRDARQIQLPGRWIFNCRREKFRFVYDAHDLLRRRQSEVARAARSTAGSALCPHVLRLLTLLGYRQGKLINVWAVKTDREVGRLYTAQHGVELSK